MARYVLTQTQRFQLTNFVKDFYVEKGLSDREFAELATKELGFEVRDNNVDAARDVVNIPSTKARALAANEGLVTVRLARLEERVNELEKVLKAVEEILYQIPDTYLKKDARGPVEQAFIKGATR